jgi:hypothetical protein
VKALVSTLSVATLKNTETLKSGCAVAMKELEVRVNERTAELARSNAGREQYAYAARFAGTAQDGNFVCPMLRKRYSHAFTDKGVEEIMEIFQTLMRETLRSAHYCG